MTPHCKRLVYIRLDNNKDKRVIVDGCFFALDRREDLHFCNEGDEKTNVDQNAGLELL